MATDAFVQVAADGPGKKIDNDELTASGSVVYRQRIRLGGTLAAALAEVLNAAPASNEYGVVVRPIPSASAQPVSGPLTDSELRNTPVPVSGTLTSVTQTTTAGTPAGFTVSTAAVQLAALNTNRRAIVITNNGTGKLYIGHTSGVTATGATMGLQVPAGGSYSDSGFGLYTGALHGIYDAVAASQNVSVSERT